MEKDDLTVKAFLESLKIASEQCASCKFFEPETDHCREHNIQVTANTPKCKSWRYFA